MANAQPKVTVLMPVYNAERFLRQSLESVLRQSWTDFELLIIDDGSTDGSARIAGEYADSGRVRIISTENHGVARALQRGVVEARGDFVARMDADDIAVRDRLRWQVEVLEEKPSVGVVFGFVTEIDHEGRVLPNGRSSRSYSDNEVQWCLLWKNVIPHPTVMFRRALVSDGGYDPVFNKCEDFELWNRLARVTRFECIPRPLVQYRIHAGSVTRTNRPDQHLEVYARAIARNLKRVGCTVDDVTARELAIISEGANVDPRRYSYEAIKTSGVKAMACAQRHFVKSGSMASWSIRSVVADQLLGWATNLVYSDLGMSIRLASRALLHDPAKLKSVELYRYVRWLFIGRVSRIQKRLTNTDASHTG